MKKKNPPKFLLLILAIFLFLGNFTGAVLAVEGQYSTSTPEISTPIPEISTSTPIIPENLTPTTTPATSTEINIYNVRVNSITKNSVKFYWNTNGRYDCFINYAEFSTLTNRSFLKNSGNIIVQGAALVNSEHLYYASLSGLKPDTSYNYYVSCSYNDQVKDSELGIFKTLKEYEDVSISNISLEKINETSVKIFWKTSTSTSYNNVMLEEAGSNFGRAYVENSGYKNNHEIILSDLKSNTSYKYNIFVYLHRDSTIGATSDYYYFKTDKVSTEKKLISYWNFDDLESPAYLLKDAEGNNDGKIYGAKKTGGVSGGALYFNGMSNYAVVPNNNNLNFGTDDFTISVWIKTSASTYPHDTDRDEILSKGDAFNSGYSLTSRHNRFSGYIGQSSREEGYNINNTIINDNIWHNMVMLREGGILKIYTDGKLEHSYSRSDNVSTPYDLYIGRHGTKLVTFWKGKIDELKIYNYALSNGEVRSAYENIKNNYNETTEKNYDSQYEFVSDEGSYTIKINNIFAKDEKLISGVYGIINTSLSEKLPVGTKLTYDLVGWADDRYVYYNESTGYYEKKWFIHPDVGLGLKKLTVSITRSDGKVIDSKSVNVEIISASASTIENFNPEIREINIKANNLSNEDKFEKILAELNEIRSLVKENEVKIKYLADIKKDIKEEIREVIENAINNFITYGVDDNTKRLGEGERAAVIHSFKSAFGRLPEDEEELADAIKIASGRWPAIKSEEAEKEAKAEFERIYKRIPDMNNSNDNAAVVVMAYGLRQKAENRNLNSERAGIKTFKNIYGRLPETTEDWNIMQSITYSGATRGVDTDRDLLIDKRERELGTDPNNPDSDGDGYLDGIEVANGYSPLEK